MSQAQRPPIPPGGDEDLGPTVLIVTWIFTSLCLITLGLRLFTRLRLTRSPGWDDFWIVIAMVFQFVYQILIIFAINAGNGRHAYYLEPQQLSNALRWNSIAFVPGIIAFSVPKLGVAILLMRLLNPGKKQRMFLYFITITCLILSLVCTVVLWQQCNPSERMWNPNVKGKCWDQSVAVNYATFLGAWSAATDIYLAAYPCTVLYKLNISKREKLGLGAVLGLGFIAGILTAYKCTRLKGLYDHSDYTYSTVDLIIWTSIEASFMIIGANLPTLRPVFLLMAGRFVPSPENSGGKGLISYKLNTFSKDSNGLTKRPPREPYPTDTIDLVGNDSDDPGLPPNRIRKTFNVSVNHQDEEAKPAS